MSNPLGSTKPGQHHLLIGTFILAACQSNGSNTLVDTDRHDAKASTSRQVKSPDCTEPQTADDECPDDGGDDDSVGDSADDVADDVDDADSDVDDDSVVDDADNDAYDADTDAEDTVDDTATDVPSALPSLQTIASVKSIASAIIILPPPPTIPPPGGGCEDASRRLAVCKASPAPSPTACKTPGQPGANPSSPNVLKRADGTIVTIPNGMPILYPSDGHDPAFFEMQGQMNASEFTGTLVTLEQAPNFAQGHVWDEQRINGNFNPQFVDYASVAIGIYFEAAGVSPAEFLTISNDYAGLKSVYPPGTVFDSTYTHLPARNVRNEMMGYTLAAANAFGVCK